MKLRPSVMLALLAVFALKAAVLLQLGHHPLLQPAGEVDDAYYRHFGEMIAGGDVLLSSKDSLFGQAPTAFFFAPLYAYFLGVVFAVTHNSVMAARWAQIALGTCGVVLLALSVRRWFGERAAWIGGALAALCGLFTFFEVLISPAALDPFFTGLDLFLLGKAADEGGRRNWMLAGAALGLHALNRPHVALVAAGLAILLAARAGWRRALVFAAAVAVVIAPATIRNYAVSRQPIPIAWNLGFNVLEGNGPEATGTLSTAAGILPTVPGEWVSSMAAATAARGHATTPFETSTYFLGQSFGWMLKHPLLETRLLARKLWYSLSATFFMANHSYVFFARDVTGVLMLLAVGPALLLPFGIAGLWFARPRERASYGLWAAFLPLALLSLVLVFVAACYRLPSLFMAAGTAGAGLSWMIDRARARQFAALAVPGGAIAALLAVAAWPTGAADGRSEEQLRMAIVRIQQGNVAEGESWVQRAIAAHAAAGLVHVRIGQVYEQLGKPNEAVSHYKQALITDPKEPAVHFALGRAYYAAGDLSAAVRELAGARVGDQQDAASRLLVVALARAGRVDETNTVIHDLDPSRWDADVAREFATQIANAGRVDLSLAAWARAAEVSGESDDYERLGLTLAMAGAGDQALPALQEAVRLDPSSSPKHQNFAAALAAAGHLAEARQECDEALRIDPGNERAKALSEKLKRR